MADMNDYKTSFTVAKTPDEVFAAINNPKGWWSGEIEGDTDKLGGEFTYNVPGAHWCRQKITEFIPGKKVVWHVLDSKIAYTKAKNEWNGTDITFEISKKGDETEVHFSHLGLVPSFECYDGCSNAWDALVNDNLRNFILTGKDQPSPF